MTQLTLYTVADFIYCKCLTELPRAQKRDHCLPPQNCHFLSAFSSDYQLFAILHLPVCILCLPVCILCMVMSSSYWLHYWTYRYILVYINKLNHKNIQFYQLTFLTADLLLTLRDLRAWGQQTQTQLTMQLATGNNRILAQNMKVSLKCLNDQMRTERTQFIK